MSVTSEFQLQNVCIPWPLQTATGCFGNTFDDFLTPSCNPLHVMAINGVFAMAKDRTTNCPEEAESSNRDEEKCCHVAPEDCKMVYMVSDMPYYSECSGLETCMTNVAKTITACNITNFLDTSNYMLMEFYCIARSLILDASSTETGTTRGTAVYVQNQGYPNSSEIGGSCSVASSCNTTIVLTVIHLNLNDNITNGCNQHLNITDGSDSHNIDCSHNNHGDYFPIRDVYISIGHFLVLDFTTVVPGAKGQLWVEVRADDLNTLPLVRFKSTFDHGLRCGSSAVSQPLAVDECPVNTTTATVSTTTPLSHTLPSSERTSTIFRNTTQNWINVMIVVGILLTMMIVLPGILECRSQRKKRANKVHSSGNTPANGHHGLPLYGFGPEPEIIKQIPPTRGRLSAQQSTRQTVHIRPSSNDSVPPELRKFGDTEMQTIPSAGPTLPPVRQPPKPSLSVDVPTLTSQSPSAGALNGHVGNNTVVEDAGQSEHMQTERKRKKKKRKKDETNEDEGRSTEGETRKRKKKKRKKTTDHDAEKEM